MATAKPQPEAVEAYIASQPQPMRPILAAAREAVRGMAPDAVETVKWGYPCYVGNGNIVSLMCFPQSVNLQFFRGALLDDPRRLLQGTGKGMRHVKLLHAKDARTPAVRALLRAAVRLDASA